MNYDRWFAFFGAIISLFILTSGIVSIQWLGWTISSFSCMAWAYYGWKDKDTPRMLMEIIYFSAALFGVYNWYGSN